MRRQYASIASLRLEHVMNGLVRVMWNGNVHQNLLFLMTAPSKSIRQDRSPMRWRENKMTTKMQPHKWAALTDGCS
jgi:hypothetical protein